MTLLKRALAYGFLLWLIPFIAAVGIFPLREAQRPLFESIMPVVLTVSVVLFSYRYFRNISTRFLNESIKLGVLWFGISLGLDLLMFMWGPMKMTFVDYMKDIGITYLIYPAVVIGFGYLKE